MGTIGGIARATIGVISGLGRRLLAEHRQIEPFGDASPSRVPKRFVSQQTRRSEAGCQASPTPGDRLGRVTDIALSQYEIRHFGFAGTLLTPGSR